MAEILIRGMEMPCKGTHLLEVWNDGEKVIVYGHHKEYKGEPFNLVELPEHGRLIDADKLLHPDPLTESTPFAFTACKIMEAPTVIPPNKETK